MMEFNFDGLVGPTHNYAGLSYGNVASQTNAGMVSNPKLVAKQGLQKMRLLMDLGIPQAVIPPQQRPNIVLLRSLGYRGDIMQVLNQANKSNPNLLAAAYSAASMWTANMATVSPSCNTLDGKVHITPANLIYNLHRAQEANCSHKFLQKIFNNEKHFIVHDPLPGYRDLSDEGAANHSSICADYGTPGLELFVYGRRGLDDKTTPNRKYPARQTELASRAIIQNHQLNQNNVLCLQQSAIAIDAGAFHNDVVFVANKNVLFYHTQAFDEWSPTAVKIEEFFKGNYYLLPVSEKELPLATAIATYLFNSQLVSTSATEMALIAPIECQQNKNVAAIIDSIIAGENPIKQVQYVECKQSMQNGGGPACLRLRVVLTKEQQEAMLESIILTPELYNKLDQWIDTHYRDEFSVKDFLDPKLYLEEQTALDQLSKILHLGSIYPFQQA